MFVGSALTIAADYLLYEGIQFIRRHGNIRVDVGLHANIHVHRVLGHEKEFDVVTHDKKYISTEPCLPTAFEPNANSNYSKSHSLKSSISTFFFESVYKTISHFYNQNFKVLTRKNEVLFVKIGSSGAKLQAVKDELLNKC